ncbi:hypothetical protein [Pedobacter endophyticus]|uniref:DUF4251 domain-containing protein n=1 Tax=Pedobacter endophyticus TaxID=2789740 RepID=A0A7S9KY38_9SPHI|nr:hypothetical protein [Pedobacter endophyticus]QPH38954.1 hypothetical protein IZT61_18100 [Pedobacter endophyticus]
MINKLLTIAILIFMSLMATAQEQIKLGSNVLLELPSNAVKYIDTAIANSLAKIDQSKAPADKSLLNRYRYKVGNAKYLFFPPGKVSDKPTMNRFTTLTVTNPKRIIKSDSRKINDNFITTNYAEGSTGSIFRFVCYNEKQNMSFRGFITFPTNEKTKTLKEINSLLENVKFLN